MPSLTIAEMLQADDLEIERVPVPEWGGHVFVRTISADQRDAFEIKYAAGASLIGGRAALVGTALCDESGGFLHPTEAEILALGKKASGPLDRIFDAVMRINKMRPQDVEELEKNCGKTADAASG